MDTENKNVSINAGQKWTDDSVNSRKKLLVYEIYADKEEIIMKTRLDKAQIIEMLSILDKYNIKKDEETVHPTIEHKDVPINHGKKWTDNEERLLLNELSKNICIDNIVKNHGRTVGSICAKQREIAYKMYKENIDMDVIMRKTLLDKAQITETITRRNSYHVKKGSKSTTEQITELKDEIISLKCDVKEMLRLINALYEFEDTT